MDVGVLKIGTYTHGVANGNTGGFQDIPNIVVPDGEEWKIDDIWLQNLTAITAGFVGQWVNTALGTSMQFMTSNDQGVSYGGNPLLQSYSNTNGIAYKQPFCKGLILPAGYKLQLSGQATSGSLAVSVKAILWATRRLTA